MKKTITLALCVILIFTCFTGCGKKSKGVEKPGTDAAFLFGDWNGESWLSEVWTFNDDGSGKNENSILPYEFDYSYADGVLSLYEYIGTLRSDSPTKYTVTVVSSNEITLVDESSDTEYTLTK